MVLLPPVPPTPQNPHPTQPRVHREFLAEVLILSHATTIKVKYQAMLHVGPVSQTCAIVGLDRAFIRTGDRATVAFRFVQRPEWVRVGDRILFREGRTKGLGIVKQLGWDRSVPLGEGGTVTSRMNGDVEEGEPARAAVEEAKVNEEAKVVVEGDANGQAKAGAKVKAEAEVNGQAKAGVKPKAEEKG